MRRQEEAAWKRVVHSNMPKRKLFFRPWLSWLRAHYRCNHCRLFWGCMCIFPYVTFFLNNKWCIERIKGCLVKVFPPAVGCSAATISLLWILPDIICTFWENYMQMFHLQKYEMCGSIKCVFYVMFYVWSLLTPRSKKKNKFYLLFQHHSRMFWLKKIGYSKKEDNFVWFIIYYWLIKAQTL